MKIIKYKMCHMANIGTAEEPQMREMFFAVEMDWSEANEEIAKKEAHNSEYEIIDDGQPDPSTEPSQLDRVESQIAYLAIITDNEEILEV